MRIHLLINENVTGNLDIPDSPQYKCLTGCGCIFILQNVEYTKNDINDDDRFYFLKCLYGDGTLVQYVCELPKIEEVAKKCVSEVYEILKLGGLYSNK